MSALAAQEVAPVAAEDNRTIYKIPEVNYSSFVKEMSKLSKRAERRAGYPISPMVIGEEMVQLPGTRASQKVYEVYLMAEMPVIGAWTFAGKIDHTNETGNIIRSVPNTGAVIPDIYRSVKPACDHCQQNRRRRDTYILWNRETDQFQQVGSTCLEDFFGQNPFAAAAMAEMLGYAAETAIANTTVSEGRIMQDRRWISVESYLGVVAVICRNYGWVSGKVAAENPGMISTRARAVESFYGRDDDMNVTDQDRALVDAAIEWARGLADKDFMNDYEHNINVVANSPFMEARSLGLATSIVGVYFNNQRKAQPAPAKIELGDFKPVIALMNRPGSKLQYPKIKLALDNKEPIVLSLAGQGASKPGTINITDGGPYGENIWYGRVTPEGEWVPSKSAPRENLPSLIALMQALGADPQGTALAYGKLTGRCCFCAKKLTNARSTEVGYGETCASHYQLPW